jgi:hypothetical protein
MRVFLLLPFLFLVSCASTRLKPGAESVVVSEAEPSENCKEVGSAESNTAVNIANATNNVLLNILRNRAFEIGGNYVKLDTQTTLKTSGRVYRCP